MIYNELVRILAVIFRCGLNRNVFCRSGTREQSSYILHGEI